MERQRSFSFKPTRLLLFSFTIFSSILFLSIFTIWLTKSTTTSSLHTQTLLHFNTSSSPPSLQPLTLHSLTITDVKIPTFIDNRLVRSQKSFSESKSEPSIVNFTAMHRDNGTSPAKRFSDQGNKVETSGLVGEIKTQVQILRNMSIELKTVKKECDLTKGYWVFDESYPLYNKDSCSFIDEGFDCEGNGRLDRNYSKWRWQPKDCDLPRYSSI